MVCVCRCVIVHKTSTTYIHICNYVSKTIKYLCVPLNISIIVFITFLASGKLDQILFIRLGNVCFPTWISAMSWMTGQYKYGVFHRFVRIVVVVHEYFDDILLNSKKMSLSHFGLHVFCLFKARAPEFDVLYSYIASDIYRAHM
jgi:hypothetical protein